MYHPHRNGVLYLYIRSEIQTKAKKNQWHAQLKKRKKLPKLQQNGQRKKENLLDISIKDF